MAKFIRCDICRVELTDKQKEFGILCDYTTTLRGEVNGVQLRLTLGADMDICRSCLRAVFRDDLVKWGTE